VKNITITSLSDFIDYPPVIQAEAGPIYVSFEAGLILRGTLLEGNRRTATW
jgi:hypothetical protein